MDNGRSNYGRGGAGSGGGRGRGGNYQNQQEGQGGNHSGFTDQPSVQQQRTTRPPFQGNSGGVRGFQPPIQQARSYSPRPLTVRGQNGPVPHKTTPQQERAGPSSGREVWIESEREVWIESGREVWIESGRELWIERPWGSTPPSPSVQPQRAQSSPDSLDIQLLKISEQPASLPSESVENRILPIRRPDRGGTLAVRSIRLLVNHFPIRFNSEESIFHYDVDIEPKNPHGKKRVSKSLLRLIRDKWFSDNIDGFSILQTAYDGEKNIFSAVPLPTGEFKVDLSDDEDFKSSSYNFTIKLVNGLKLSKLKDYLSGNLPYIPRDILQGMDLVMKDNPFRHRISVGRGFYSHEIRAGDDLHCGVAAYRGFQQSLKPTSQGLALCLDYSVLAFRKPLPVIEFLKEHVSGFKDVSDVTRLRQEVTRVLEGLKVRVSHRATKQIYTIARLTSRNAREISFSLVGPEGKQTEQIRLVDYFKDKWGKDILFKDIPCLDLSKNNKPNDVPIEFCVLVEGQRYPKEYLGVQAGSNLRRKSLVRPEERKNTIYQMVHAKDGPCGMFIGITHPTVSPVIFVDLFDEILSSPYFIIDPIEAA
ncbi:Protein argonaute 2 [Forsythia ovata]|uniref:Protein argonaute 2 n=1 Tax=Forsythia ovata TaxID=205694 RepID=A0ABD1QEB7_9LAMI